eukprot:3710360-Amphidinium_carterae.1
MVAAESCSVHQKNLPPNKLQAVHTPLKKTVRNALPLNFVYLLVEGSTSDSAEKNPPRHWSTRDPAPQLEPKSLGKLI